jgi:hypothetical protein
MRIKRQSFKQLSIKFPMVMNLTLSLYPTKRSKNRAHIWLFEKLAKKEKQKQKQKQKQNSNG